MNGVFQQINFMGLGVQVDVYAERMTDIQLGIFCLVGALATFCVGYLLTALAKIICRAQSKLLRAVMYYITIALLLLDPLYLSILCGFFGGGDMNGIALLCPGSFPEGFCGYYAEEHGEILYVGFHFSAVFGFLKPAILRLPSPSRARFTGSSTRQEHQKPPSGQLLQALGILNRIKQQGKSREKLLRLVSYCL